LPPCAHQTAGEARRLIAGNGLSLNGRPCTDAAATIGPADLVDNELVVLRSGKRSYRLVWLADA